MRVATTKSLMQSMRMWEWLNSAPRILLSHYFCLLKTAQSAGGTLPGVTEVQDAISTPTLTLSSLFPLAWLSPSPLVLS